jgi:hypothetical protein
MAVLEHFHLVLQLIDLSLVAGDGAAQIRLLTTHMRASYRIRLSKFWKEFKLAGIEERTDTPCGTSDSKIRGIIRHMAGPAGTD